MKSGKTSFDFHSRYMNDFCFPKMSLVHESNPVPSTVNKQLLQISTKIEHSSVLSREQKIGHV